MIGSSNIIPVSATSVGSIGIPDNEFNETGIPVSGFSGWVVTGFRLANKF